MIAVLITNDSTSKLMFEGLWIVKKNYAKYESIRQWLVGR